MPARPTGRLIQNTQRQLACTRLPPITGPRAAPSAPSADHVPMARARPAPGTAASSSDSEAGTMSPAPMAWTTRKAISAPTPGTRPHSSDPRLNATSPAVNTRRRPIRSAHRPAGTSTAANTMVEAVSTHDSELRLVPAYSRPMYGKARLTMNRSRLDMNTARDRTPTMAVTWRALRGAAVTAGAVAADEVLASSAAAVGGLMVTGWPPGQRIDSGSRFWIHPSGIRAVRPEIRLTRYDAAM